MFECSNVGLVVGVSFRFGNKHVRCSVVAIEGSESGTMSSPVYRYASDRRQADRRWDRVSDQYGSGQSASAIACVFC